MYEDAPFDVPVVDPRLEPVARKVAGVLFSRLEASLPPGVLPVEVADYQRRQGEVFVQRLLAQLAPYTDKVLARLKPGAAANPAGPAGGQGLVGKRERTEANLAAMNLLASRRRGGFTPAEKQVLARYSGWGGLSLEDVAGRFPAGLPVPEKRGLIHEYYTRTDVAEAVAAAVRDWPEVLPRSAGDAFAALEPSAGIGRFLDGFARADVPVQWTAAEYSAVSARLLRARFDDQTIVEGPFERWAAANPAEAFDLVVSNPPYGVRGVSLAEDDVGQDIRQAYAYFIWRTVNLLRPGGLAVYLVPGGFMTGTGRRMAAFREKVLKVAHLAAAFRLPSVDKDGGEPLFPGANLVVDLIFMRRRPRPLATLPAEDEAVAAGRYFRDFASHVLGEVVGDDDGAEESGKQRRGRWGYEIRGVFRGLPAMELNVTVRPFAEGKGEEAASGATLKGGRGRGSVVASEAEVLSEDAEVIALDAIGRRVGAYLKALANDDDKADLGNTHAEILADLADWVGRNGSPADHLGVSEAATVKRAQGVQQLLAVVDAGGAPRASMAKAPKVEPRYQGPPEPISIAAWLQRQRGRCEAREVAALWSSLSGARQTPAAVEEALEAAGWCEDDASWWPEAEYLSGELWPKHDRLDALAERAPERATRQRALLMAAIEPATWSDLVEPVAQRDDEGDVLGDGGLTPRDRFVPVEQIMRWQQASVLFMAETGGRYSRAESVDPLKINATPGGLTVNGLDYHRLPTNDKDRKAMGAKQHGPHLQFVGWYNHDNKLWTPPRLTTIVDGEEQKESMDAARVRVSSAWIVDFRAWVKRDEEAQRAIEQTYNRMVRGRRPLTVQADPLPVARWTNPKIKLHGYQHIAANRILRRRRGLLAFDVGLGKTYTGLHILARARQEGWARRPVILVPNSIVWKWSRDIKRVLPDYRVVVIGSKLKLITRGDRKGRWVAETDTGEERAQKWSDFAAGAYDVALLTQSMVGRQRIEAATLTDFAEKVEGIRRLAAMARAEGDDGRGDEEDEGSKKPKNSTERQDAVREEAGAGWLMKMLQGNIGQDYDPGITWEKVGCDLLMVDESQNYKNLFMAEQREGGIPDGLGAGQPSKRAWHLAFRAHAVRMRTGGAGVVLLSATPAKNSPLEFYNAVQLVEPEAFERIGIGDPESFISRFCLTQQAIAQKPDGSLVVRSAVKQFGNLTELRAVINDVAEFRTAEEVGLKIPEALPGQVQVDLSPEQQASIGSVIAEIGEIQDEIRKAAAMKNTAKVEALRLKVMGLSASIDMMAIHDKLPDVSGDKYSPEKAARTPLKGRAPKVEACVNAVLEGLRRDGVCSSPPDGCRSEHCMACGHIIFIENVAVHDWIVRLLVEGGVPPARIGVLNARVAKDPETRQQIAEGFNGVGCPDDDEYAAPKYDVIIANSVAYEGVDLQRRTCQIHHIDLPWEPATLQQRNGRGVRQGALAAEVKVTYYLARGSLDARRLVKIDTKQSWMKSLVSSQDRVTNNPAAGSDLTVAEMIAELSSPAQRAQALAWAEEDRLAQEAARRQRTARAANTRLVAAMDRFHRAGRSEPATAERLRREAEAILVAVIQEVIQRALPFSICGAAVRTPRDRFPAGPRSRGQAQRARCGGVPMAQRRHGRRCCRPPRTRPSPSPWSGWTRGVVVAAGAGWAAPPS